MKMFSIFYKVCIALNHENYNDSTKNSDQYYLWISMQTVNKTLVNRKQHPSKTVLHHGQNRFIPRTSLLQN